MVVLIAWASVQAQEGYLIKLGQISPERAGVLKESGIKICAQTADFFLAEATDENLKFLQEKEISYTILDDQADFSLYFLVWCRPDESIQKYLPQIRQKARVLEAEKDRALVTGQPRMIEELTSLGLSLQLLSKKALPLRVQPEVSLVEGRTEMLYHPVIDSVMQKVTQSDLTGFVGDLSGENSVIIGGSPYTLATRYTFTQGCDKAAQYIKEKFESYGLVACYDTFNIAQAIYLMDIVSVPSGETLWAGGLYGGIWKSVDGGDNWYHIDLTDGYNLWALAVPSPETLYGAGNGGTIIKSTDAGETWSLLPSPTGVNLRGAYFEDSEQGWVTGYSGAIFYTSDGGQTWTDQSTGTNNLYEITFVDSNNGWVVGGNGTILHTSNRGTNWTSQTSGISSGIIFGVDFATPQKGWVCGQNGYLRYTTNAGTNWTSQASGTAGALYMVTAPDSQKVWACTNGGELLSTTNAETNWNIQYPPGNTGLFYEVYFADTLQGWLTGYTELLQTTNGGQSWINHGSIFPSYQKLNVVAELPGVGKAGQECIITAHYDNTSENPANLAPGADDNGSGTAAVLEAAKVLKDYQFDRTIKFISFAGEEQGLLGSYAYAQKASQAGDTIVGVFNLDMIAWEGDSVNVIELHSGTGAASQALADITTGVINTYSLPLIPQKITIGATTRSDHASFWNYGYPAMLGIEDFDEFNPYYHTTNDLLSVLDLPYFTNFAKAGIASAAILAEPYPACLAVPGDVNASGGIPNLQDVIYLVNFVFDKSRVTPPCSGTDPVNCWPFDPICRGDVNGSGGTPNLQDVPGEQEVLWL